MCLFWGWQGQPDLTPTAEPSCRRAVTNEPPRECDVCSVTLSVVQKSTCSKKILFLVVSRISVFHSSAQTLRTTTKEGSSSGERTSRLKLNVHSSFLSFFFLLRTDLSLHLSVSVLSSGVMMIQPAITTRSGLPGTEGRRSQKWMEGWSGRR